MADEKELAPAKPAQSKEEVALDLMRFIVTTTGMGRPGSTAGFGERASKSVDDQVDSLLQLFGKCRDAVK